MYIANTKIEPRRGSRQHGLSVPGVPATAAEMAIVGFIIIVGLYFGQVVLVPLALAVILSFVLAPAVRAAEARRPPQHAPRSSSS